jgi:hypothetical protein
MTIQKSVKKTFLKMLDPGSPFLFTTTIRAASTFFVALLALAGTIQVQGQSAAAREIVPEEIIVTLPESLSSLRREVYRAENKVFDVFNELNDDLEYDIKCKMENRHGTKMRVRVCKPNYYRFAMEEEGETLARKFAAFMEVGPAVTGPGQMFYLPTPNIDRIAGPGTSAIPHKDKKMDQLIRTAIAVSPEFVEAVREYDIINKHYEETRKARFEE